MNAIGRVTVTVSGPTGSGKSRLAMEIEIALKAIDVKVVWTDAAQEREARLVAWAEQSGSHLSEFPEVTLQEITTPISIADGFKKIGGSVNIVYYLDPDGGFTCGDTETRITCYAYPTSLSATQARRNPKKVAERMLENEHRYGFEHEAEYDQRMWAKLDKEGAM